MLVVEAGTGQVTGSRPDYEETISLADVRSLLNPGSVGQPRDDDPRAAYALLDTDRLTWQFCRTPYAIAETQRLMREANLPVALGERLSYGW